MSSQLRREVFTMMEILPTFLAFHLSLISVLCPSWRSPKGSLEESGAGFFRPSCLIRVLCRLLPCMSSPEPMNRTGLAWEVPKHRRMYRSLLKYRPQACLSRPRILCLPLGPMIDLHAVARAVATGAHAHSQRATSTAPEPPCLDDGAPMGQTDDEDDGDDSFLAAASGGTRHALVIGAWVITREASLLTAHLISACPLPTRGRICSLYKHRTCTHAPGASQRLHCAKREPP